MSCSMVIFIIIACLFGGRIVDHLLTKTQKFEMFVFQSNGKVIPVSLVKQTKGFYISGGHGWSVGSTKDSYEVTFRDGHTTVHWQGAAVPITLQNQGALFYLATYDRETLHQTDFKCYVWQGAWKNLPVNLFPKSLATINLMNLGPDSSLSFSDPQFRTSLLARFWYCIESGLHEWEVSDSMIYNDFGIRFGKALEK